MAAVVMVHGEFNELWGAHEIKARWLPALRDGLVHAGATVAEDDVEVGFYGDLFRRPVEPGALASFEQTRAGVAEMLSGVLGTGSEAIEALGAAANEAVLDRTIDLVTTMATDPELRDKIAARIDAVITPDTKVVVAHSLGSVVMYRYLTTRPELTPDLVTMGSPLGAPTLGALDPSLGKDGAHPWPGGVGRWTNVAAVGDRAAVEPRLATLFGDRVEDHTVDNGHRVHDPEPYLNSACTGAAVARALA